MKKNIIGATLFILACFVLWQFASPQLQLKNQSSANLKVATQKINSLQLRIQRLENELNKLQKVIKVKANGVEITTPGSLKLKGMNLELKSQMNLNMNIGMNLNMNANMKVKINGKVDMLLKSGAKMNLKSCIIFLN